MKLKTGILACLMLMMMQACVNEPDKIFDGSTARVEAQLKEFDQTLQQAENGWVMYFFPEASQKWGGYVVHLKFDNAGGVSIGSEAIINDDASSYTKIEHSLYALKYDMGPTLNFDTYNSKLHYYSDPDLQVGDGRGYGFGGDYEFLFKEVSKSKIVLEGKKTRNRIIMIPLDKSTNWNDYLKDVDELSQKIAIKDLRLSIGGNDIETERIGDRCADFMVDGKQSRLSFAIVPNGIQLYAPLTLGGEQISDFVYDTEKGQLVASNGVKIELDNPKGALNYYDFFGSWTMTSTNVLSPLEVETNQISISPKEYGKTFEITGLGKAGDIKLNLVGEYTTRGELRFTVHRLGSYEDKNIWLGFLNDQTTPYFGGSFMTFAWNGQSMPQKLAKKTAFPKELSGFFYAVFSTIDPQPTGMLGVWEGMIYTDITFVKN